MRLNERLIAIALMKRRLGSSVIIRNFHPPDWWDVDVFAIDEDGRWTEFEIKTSMSDFIHDQAKTKTRWSVNNGVWERTDVTKHGRLGQGDTHGPNWFYVVVPEAIAKAVKSVLPPWAGMIVVKLGVGVIQETTIVEAPQLHDETSVKMRESVLWHAYHQMHRRSTGVPWEELLPMDGKRTP